MKILGILCILVLGVACSKPQPRDINYTTEQCSACKMNITDKRFAAQAVLTTGKQIVFDAPECMIGWYLKGADGMRDKIHTLYVTNYASPATFIPAESAAFAVGEAWASPMGLDAAAFSSAAERDNQIKAKGGDALTYQALLRVVESE